MRAIKRAVPHSFQINITEQVILTLEGLVVAFAGDIILTGVRGERWPIAKAKFEQTYDFDLETMQCRKKPLIVTAEEMTESFEVTVGWAKQPIYGKAGDFRITYGPGDFGVVARDIFFETYEIIPSPVNKPAHTQ